jgi:CRISPR/Cas system CMR subunit Cmr4 (Cas7 group RAMP superfamily)
MVGKYSVRDFLLITSSKNLNIGSSKVIEIVYLPILKDTYGFPTIYYSQLREAKDFSFFNKIFKDIFLRWER